MSILTDPTGRLDCAAMNTGVANPLLVHRCFQRVCLSCSRHNVGARSDRGRSWASTVVFLKAVEFERGIKPSVCNVILAPGSTSAGGHFDCLGASKAGLVALSVKISTVGSCSAILEVINVVTVVVSVNGILHSGGTATTREVDLGG